MKRWPLRILLCLILLTGGAITTVAVAWGSLMYSPRFFNARETETLYTIEGPGVTESRHWLSMSNSDSLFYIEAGFPFRMFWNEGEELSDQIVNPRYGIIWPGFAIDTLFYAAIWGGAWFGVVGGKRFIRSKRGRCPRCGYDLRGNRGGGCSECGWNREESTA